MAGRPTPEMHQLRLSVPRGFADYWAIIRELDELGPWAASEVARRTKADASPVSDYVRRLKAGGFARVVGFRGVTGRPPVPLLRLEQRPTAAPRLRRDGSECPPTGQEQMWRAIRSLSQFDYVELAYAASTDNVRVNEAAARDYIKHLAGADYLAAVQVAKPGKRGIWRLKPAMNTGPLPPRVMRTKFVWDQNRCAIFGDASETEEAR